MPFNQSSTDSGSPTLFANYTTRMEILGFVNTNPGVYLREVSEEMGLALGDVQYHLWILVRDGELTDSKDGRYRRFFESGRYSEMEQKVIAALRQGTTGRILLKLTCDKATTHAELAEFLGMTSQAVTWQMVRLKSLGIVEAAQGFRCTSYRVTEEAREFVVRYLQDGQPRIQRAMEIKEPICAPRIHTSELFA